MQKSTAQGTTILSFLLLLVYSIFLLTNQGNAKMFCFGWTWRSGVNQARSLVPDMYKTNLDTRSASLDHLHKTAMEKAFCKGVDYGARLAWKEDDVSPLCRCLSNAHLEYTRAVCPGGHCLSNSTMLSPQVNIVP